MPCTAILKAGEKMFSNETLSPFARNVVALVIDAADSQVKLEFIVRELGSIIFANFPSIRVGLPDGRGSPFLDLREQK